MNLNKQYDRLPEPYRFIIMLIATFPIWSLTWWKNYPTILGAGSIYTVLFLLFVLIPRIFYIHRRTK